MYKRNKERGWAIRCLSALIGIGPGIVSADVTITILETKGIVSVKKAGERNYRRLAQGETLSTCDTIKLLHSNDDELSIVSSIKWVREGDCPNKGKAVSTADTEKTRTLHVGTDIGNPGPLPPGGYFDLLLDDDAKISTATIIEGQSCEGTGHCGLNSPMALAVAIEPTPPEHETVFSGEYGFNLEGQEYTHFINYPPNSIPLVSVPYFGPFSGEHILVPPGQMITWHASGVFELSEAPPCTGAEDLKVTACRQRACGSTFKAKLSRALPGSPVTFTRDGRVFDRAVVNDRGKAVGRFCGETSGSHLIGVVECESAVAESNCP
ncbi:MAG: hypothetical protein KJ057_10065 [Phycisphaerae bacterium]|nr:MAG: hypothetical protein F9K17_03105 [Phycisphaerae bacterium]MBE7458388.1 hypothetical protein [Planctomycetia bacterium]MCK6465202.1 hypothetical protein [Phycisphaerae bacterium]MCL4718803.1 hypothetical protein [Phycisphaerae bacterium]NUQ08882.1 hypothetical protein [Phycisphaerae bacterium]